MRGIALLVGLLASLAVGAGSTPSQPLVRVRGDDVLVRAPVSALAADGGSVAFVFCEQLLAIWQPQAGTLAPVGRSKAFACPPPVGAQQVLGLALAGGLVAWAVETGGNTVDNLVFSAQTRIPSDVATVREVIRCCRAEPGDAPTQDRLGDVYGHGVLLVFASRQKCGDPDASACATGEAPTLISSAVWAVRSPTARATQLLSSDRQLEPIAVGGGRVAVQDEQGAVAIVDSSGRTVRTFASLSGRARRGAVLTSRELIALVPGRLLELDIATGRQISSRPLPDLPSAGVCGLPPCPAVEIRLLDAARGLVAYLLNGKLHLLRLRDGRDVAVGRASDARFGQGGLVSVSKAAAPWADRIRFAPWNGLPLAP